MHWCMDETLALLAGLTSMRVLFAYLQAKWSTRRKPCCGHEHEVDEEQIVSDEAA